MSARITDLGIAAIQVMDEPNLTNLAEYGDIIRAQYDAELTALRQQVADLRAALATIDAIPAVSPLEACAYTIPTKKWVKQEAPALQARYDTLLEVKTIAHTALAAMQPQEVQS